jgi:hypothetical protein
MSYYQIMLCPYNAEIANLMCRSSPVDLLLIISIKDHMISYFIGQTGKVSGS